MIVRHEAPIAWLPGQTSRTGRLGEHEVEDPVDARAVQGQPAVHDDVLPRHEARQVRAQEDHDVGHVLGLADPRPTGVPFSKRSTWSGMNSNIGAVMAVRIMPGDTAFTRIEGAYSRAADAVSAATAALLAA